MFTSQICSHPGCKSYVSAPFGTCFHHSGSKEKEIILESLRKTLSSRTTVRDVSIIGGDFENLDISGKSIWASNFSFSTFRSCDFSSSRISTSFFDMCIFIDCVFSELSARYCVFSGSRITRCSFAMSTMFNCNLIGLDCLDNDFSSSDLYFSNFSMSRIENTKFEEKGVKVSAARARKALAEISKLCKERRKEIQEKKDSAV